MQRGLLVIALFGGAAAAAEAQAPVGHDLMPAALELTWQEGRLVVDSRFNLAATGSCDGRVERALRAVSDRLERATGITFTRPVRTGGSATLVVECAGEGLPVQSVTEDESYALTVTPRGAQLTAPNPLGALRGLETFVQLVRRDGPRNVVPAVKIQDRPRFPWRGLLIDPCRRWQPVEVIKRNLDGMAAVKLNVLHWHLSEDQGFRVESRKFPRLHELGSDGLFFSQEQVKEVVAYARERGIRVVPEFDVPGHATSWLVGYPELGSAPGSYTLIKNWGIFDPSLDPTREEVYQFLDGFLGEMAALFPDEYMHIGGDEVTGRPWNDNPRIQNFLYENGLRDKHDLQAHFNQRVNKILTKHGKKMVGWDEILHPDLPKSILVQSWQGAEKLSQSARGGYDGILSKGYYLDHMLPAADHYAADPIPRDSTLSPDERRHVLGGEACMWGEFVSPEIIDSRIWPRAAAVAERLWSAPEVRDVDDMYRRLEIQSVRLDALGLTHRSSYLPMLRRLAGERPAESLKVLADVVEPVKLYRRGEFRRYTTETPLDRLVDSARPESDAARIFRKAVDGFLTASAQARVEEPIRASLSLWKENHATLDPILAASPKTAELRTLSKDLSELGLLGLQALEHLAAGTTAPDAWFERAKTLLQGAQSARAEVELTVVPSVARLAYAAAGQKYEPPKAQQQH